MSEFQDVEFSELSVWTELSEFQDFWPFCLRYGALLQEDFGFFSKPEKAPNDFQ